MGNCTFLNRSNGLNLKKSSCVDGSSNERQSSCHSLRLTQQKLPNVIVMAKKERMSMYSRGVSVAMDRAVDKAADSVNIPLTDSLKLECDQPKVVDLLTWYSNATCGHPQCIEDLREIHSSYVTASETLSAAMAAERAARYHEFMKRAVSHKNGQAVHRILKKKPNQMARPVSKDKMDATEDQHHADEQISIWSKVWHSNIDSADHMNTLDWRKKNIDPTRAFSDYSSLDISDAYIACPNEPQGCTFRSAQMLVLAHWQDHCTFGSLQKPKANPLKNKFSNYMVNHYIREEQGRDDNK